MTLHVNNKLDLLTRPKPVFLFMAVVALIVLLAACTTSTTSTSFRRVTSTSNAVAVPILTESQAIETANLKAALSRRGLAGVSNIRNQQARLMTMGEYWALGQYDEGFFGSAEWYPESGLPVWVVLIEGDSESISPTSSPLTPTRFSYFVVVLNAQTGYQIGVSPLSGPDQLASEAQGLDPDFYARYPMEASLEYIKGVTDFPVSEPSFLPAGFSLARVTLELAHPLQDVLPYPQEPRQSAIQNYSDGEGRTIQLAQFRGELPDLIENASLSAVLETKAWTSPEVRESTWLAWTWVFPDAGAYVTNILYSEARSVSLDSLHQIAASMPVGRPPQSTPDPASAPTAQLRPISTLTPAPQNAATGCSGREETPPCGPGVEIGKPYRYALYTHCGVRSAYLDGREWIADPILRAGSGPPRAWGDPFERGSMELITDNLARFTSDAGLTAEFRPLPEGTEYPWKPCV